MPPKNDGPLQRTWHWVLLFRVVVRVLERSRFRGPTGSERAWEHAFQPLGLTHPAPEGELPEIEYEEVSDFPEIGAELLSVDAWHLVDNVVSCGTRTFATRNAVRASSSAVCF